MVPQVRNLYLLSRTTREDSLLSPLEHLRSSVSVTKATLLQLETLRKRHDLRIAIIYVKVTNEISARYGR